MSYIAVCESLCARLLSRRQSECAIVISHFVDDALIARGEHYDSDVLRILRRGTNHRRTTDIDLFDRFCARYVLRAIVSANG